jgi:hypothetical protein
MALLRLDIILERKSGLGKYRHGWSSPSISELEVEGLRNPVLKVYFRV